MITGELKNKIDRLWLEFWQAGITNPITVIEQITFLMYSRLLDINETRDEKVATKIGRRPNKRRFDRDQQHLRWSNFLHEADPEKLMTLVRDSVFRHFREQTSSVGFGEYMKDARFGIDKPALLIKAIDMISQLPLESGDSKGDLYEYLLSKLTTAGINGQFRTPRHIISLMVKLMNPTPQDIVVDPACGTGGFLATTFQHLIEKNTSDEGVIEEEIEDENGNSRIDKIYTGDRLSDEQWSHIKSGMFFGFDFDITMLRIAAMNLFMHGVEDPNIHYQDTLAQNFSDHYPHLEQNAFDIVLANPPFKGSLDQDTINPSILRSVKTSKTELLFVAQILRMLKVGGRSATIVPQGVLFGSSKAHLQMRKLLIEDNQLDAVINLPSGVFKPYAGVATAILLFTKAGITDHIWFYDVEDDGFSLDDKREALHETAEGAALDFAGDLPKILEGFESRDKSIANTDKNDLKQPHFWVSKENIINNSYDLSINRYKEIEYEEIEYDPPLVILDQLEALEAEIQDDLKELRSMLR